MQKLLVFLAGLMICACASQQTTEVQSPQAQERSGQEIFFADSLNSLSLYRTYPVPDVKYTPVPKGYKPVYISSYARHGSRKLISYRRGILDIFAYADSAGCLTPFGKEVYGKLLLMDKDMENSNGDLTSKGMRQHKGIAERMYRNYPNVFSKKGTPVRLYSTNTQRTMFSMFACDEQLIELNPSIVSTRKASDALSYLIGDFDKTKGKGFQRRNIVAEYFDAKPALGKLFSGEVPVLKDTADFISALYDCAKIVHGLDLEDAEYIWDLFTREELFTLQQASSYHLYLSCSNAPQYGDLPLLSMRPLLKDFVDKADVALQEEIPGADLRFGHDVYLIPLIALIGVNGYVKQEEDPLKVIDTFQDFRAAPMAGNLQMVFFRNKSGDILVKFLQNEIESWIPIETDMYPYYHWNDVREYLNSLIGE